jgi:hypothetical protein
MVRSAGRERTVGRPVTIASSYGGVVRRLLSVLLVGCGGSEPATDAPDPDAAPDGPAARCTRCLAPGAIETLGAAPAGLVEASGMVASRDHAGVLYAHNDSGDSARVFVFDAAGTSLATLSLSGVTPVDWEDIAIGPCAAGSCLYVGDIGDNGLVRATKTIYRFSEPVAPSGATSIADVEAFPFTYPNGMHNAETLLVHPTTGDVYVVTKENVGAPSVVFKFPQPLVAGQTATLVEVVTLPFPTGTQPDVSGGDIDPCGSSVLLRLGSEALYVLEPSGAFDTAFSAAPRELPIASEANGEAITWDADGAGYLTVSEGAGARIHRVACP